MPRASTPPNDALHRTHRERRATSGGIGERRSAEGPARAAVKRKPLRTRPALSRLEMAQ